MRSEIVATAWQSLFLCGWGGVIRGIRGLRGEAGTEQGTPPPEDKPREAEGGGERGRAGGLRRAALKLAPPPKRLTRVGESGGFCRLLGEGLGFCQLCVRGGGIRGIRAIRGLRARHTRTEQETPPPGDKPQERRRRGDERGERRGRPGAGCAKACPTTKKADARWGERRLLPPAWGEGGGFRRPFVGARGFGGGGLGLGLWGRGVKGWGWVWEASGRRGGARGRGCRGW